MDIAYYLVDVFTGTRFSGNPLAVVVDAVNIPEGAYQKIANEFNLSETAFILPPENRSNDFRLRIFTPASEIPTAGHPTIGTTHVIINELKRPLNHSSYLVYEQIVGNIRVDFHKINDEFGKITMQQPLPDFGPVIEDRQLIADILSVGKGDLDDRYPVQAVSCGNNFLYIPVKKMRTLGKVKIRLDLLEEHEKILTTPELYIFSFETVNQDSTTHARMFAPMFGIFEDPATGSASGPLGCYLVKHGLTEGKGIVCEQGFEMGRPSVIHVDIGHKNGKIFSVKVAGDCVTMGKGYLMI